MNVGRKGQRGTYSRVIIFAPSGATFVSPRFYRGNIRAGTPVATESPIMSFRPLVDDQALRRNRRIYGSGKPDPYSV